MGMYENLKRLQVALPDSVELYPIEHGEVATFCIEAARDEAKVWPACSVADYSAGMHFGVLVGLCYAAEFGIPDVAKNLFSVEAN
ncbi:hypothetical protein LCGC14_3066010 [marine sediment metagenome]|uniref:Uncharacterized protein n=1 Tax=marine sediment metagenome TaxID=412755 RepID=A0A0F8X5R9_9ZZZZ